MGYNLPMTQQRRTLSGMTNGLPIAIPGLPAPVTIHQLDAAPTGDNNGRPFLNDVSLFFQNSDAALPAQVQVTLIPPTGATVTFVVIVAAGTTVQLFDEQPLGGPASAPNGGALIRVGLNVGVGLSTLANAWGWFVAN